jgi:hypothetical protein
MPDPTLVAELDFIGNPTATFPDIMMTAPGAVSFWRMNSTSTFLDTHAANNGVIDGSPSLVAGALPLDTDQALSFNGTSAYVVDSSSLATKAAMTIQGWVKLASLPGSTKTLVAKQGSWLLQITSAGLLTWTLKDDNSTGTITGSTALTTGVYHHVACVYDNTSLLIYLDGALDGSVAYASGMELAGQPIRFAAELAVTAPAYQSTQDATVNPGTVLTITKPVSTASGDLLLAQITHYTEAATVTPPTDWKLLTNLAAGAGIDPRTRTYYKLAGGSEPANYSWTFSVSAAIFGHISRFTGVDQIAPIANVAWGKTNASGTTHTTGAHTPNMNNTLGVAMFSLSNGGGSWTSTFGAEAYDTLRDVMYYGALATQAQQNITATSSISGRSNATLLFLAGADRNYTTATLDDWSYWNIALDAETISEHYQSKGSGVGAWVNVTSDVKGVSSKTGRQYELDRIEAGQATAAMNDLQRRYDPANTNSPFSPNVIPLRKMRLRATHNAVTYPLFKGFVERWPETWRGPNHAETTVTLVDGFEPLALAGVSGLLAAGPSGSQINALLNQAGWPLADRAIDTGIFTMASKFLDSGAFALTEIQEIANSELGIFFIDRDGIATLHDRQHRWTASRSLNSQATFTDTGGNIAYQDLQPSFDKDKTVNEWQVTTDANESVTASDAASIAAYFKRSQTRSTRLDNIPDASTQALALLQDTAKPSLRFDTLTVIPTNDTAWATVLGLRISDRVTVIRNPVPAAGGSQINKLCFIEGISWNIVPGPNGTILGSSVSFQLSPVISATYYDLIVRDGPISYWRMDTAA